MTTEKRVSFNATNARADVSNELVERRAEFIDATSEFIGAPEDVVDPSTASVDAAGVANPVGSRHDPASGESEDETDAPHPRRRLIFAIVSMALFMASVDATIVATALHPIQKDLHAGLQWGGWVITIYALGQVLVMPLAGKVADMYGQKRVFLIAAALFTVASLLCGLSVNIYMLVALRAVQAIGGGAFMPSASGLVADHFGKDRDRALGMFTSIFPIGGVVGPILGGIFVTFWSWRGIFLINVPIGIALIILGLIFFPASKRTSHTRIDFYGVVLLGIIILSAMLGITYLGDATSSPLSVNFILPELIAVAGIWLFIRHANRAKNSFISTRLLFGRGFGTMNALNFLTGASALGFAALVPVYAQDRFGIPILAAGTLLTARAIGMILIAGLAVMALRRTGYRMPILIGTVTVAVGLVMMVIVPSGMSEYVWLSIGACVTGLGMGLSIPASNNAVLHLAPDQVAGVSGLRGMFRQSGAIIAVSVATAVAARSAEPGLALAYVFLVFAAILILSIPLIFRVAEHRGSW